MIPELPAQDIEAEQSLIASLILNNTLFDDCEYLYPDDFYRSDHKLIYQTMLDMRSKQEPIDLATVWYEIKKEHRESIVSPGYIAKIAETSSIFNTKKYVSIIKECSLTRQIKIKCMNIIDSKTVGEGLLSMAQTDLLGIQPASNSDDIKQLKRIIISHVERLENANSTKAGVYYKLGFPRIDKCLKTIGPKLIIIAGRPGSGKTALAVTMSRNLDKTRVKVCFLSIEMPESEIVDRWLSQESNVDSSKFGKYKGFDNKEMQAVNDASAVLYESDIMIDGSGSLDIIDIERKGRKAKKDGAQVLFIDQLSQIGNRLIKSGDLTALYTENVTRLARLKKELNIPIFLLCQLNRDMKNRSNKEPIISDLKQSGKIEEDADAIIFVHRPEEYADTKAEIETLHGKAVLNLAKNRSGAKFRDNKIRFVHETTYFHQEESWSR